MRKVFFWLHLTVGLIGGIVILTMSLTGVLLMYEKQIVEWLDLRDYRVTPPSPDAARLPLETILTKIRDERSAAPSTITVRADPTAPLEAGFGREATVYVNPYTGQVLGEGSRRVRDFFRATTDWHRWLAMQDEGRETGRAITGACNLGFLFIVMSGFYLWWPRKWTPALLRNVTWFRRGLPGKARDFNWHNVFGFWSAVPLVFIVLGGVIMSYPWANDLLYRAFGSEPPQRREGPPRARGEGRGPGEGRRSNDSAPRTADFDGVNQAWAQLEQHLPGARSISVRLPASKRAPIVPTVNQGTSAQPQYRTTLTLDRNTGAVRKTEHFSDLEPGQRARVWFRFVHTGEYFGIAGQTIAGIASAGAVMLVCTGLSLAIRRFWAWRRRRQRPVDRETPEEMIVRAGR